jgi:hypothetical protein
MQSNTTIKIAILSVAMLATAPALSAQPAAAPADKGYAEVQVWSGGVGEEAREALREQAQRANLKVEFASLDGRYLSNVKLTVSRSGRKVLEAISEGPWLFAQLPAGTYKLVASTPVSRQTKTVRLSSGRRSTVLFHLREEP